MLDVVAKDRPSDWPARDPRAACMFCSRPPRQVRMMISGPRVFLCDGCVHEAANFLAAHGRPLV
jgi:hypothetical protein